jgi:hypothetical protein
MGRPARDVQTYARHADVRRTERYDRRRQNLKTSPAIALGALLDRTVPV